MHRSWLVHETLQMTQTGVKWDGGSLGRASAWNGQEIYVKKGGNMPHLKCDGGALNVQKKWKDAAS